MIEWRQVGKYFQSDIGSAVKQGRKWLGTYNHLKHDAFDREYFENCTTSEDAIKNVEKAYRAELQRRAEMIGCVVVDKDMVVIDKDTYDELVERSMALGGHYKDGQ